MTQRRDLKGLSDVNAAGGINGQAVTTDEGFSMVTTSSGQGPQVERYDVLYIIDSAEESLFIYYIDNANSPATSRLDLKNGAYLPSLFNAAR